MKYLCLIYSDETQWAAMSEEQAVTDDGRVSRLY